MTRLLLIGMVAVMHGCVSGHTFVLERPAMPLSIDRVRPAAEVALDPTLRDRFEQELRRRLRKHPEIHITNDAGESALVMEYRLITRDEGNAAARVGNGVIQVIGVPVSGLGDGTMGVEARFLDASGNRIAHVVAHGPVAGIFGSPERGMELAAASVAEFVRETFGADRTGQPKLKVAVRD
jgi:hypothetical protein